MKEHPVPQNITSYQFRLIGDMTLKQFFELLAGGVLAFLFYATNLPGLIKLFFITISLFAGVAFAFMPLEERPLDRWLLAFLKAVYRPLQFVWRKSPAVPDYFSFASKSSPASAASPVAAVKSPSHQNAPTPAPANQDQARVSQIISLFYQTPSVAPKPQTPPVPPLPANHSPTPPAPAAIGPSGIISFPLSPKPAVSKPAPVSVSPSNPLSVSLPLPPAPQQPNLLVGAVVDSQLKLVENAVVEIADNSGNPVRATKTNKLGQFFLATPLKNGTYLISAEKEPLAFATISLDLTGQVVSPLAIKAQVKPSSPPAALS